MSLPGYLKFINDPSIVLVVALLGLWLLHRASSAPNEDTGEPILLDRSGKKISRAEAAGRISLLGKKDFITTGVVAVAAIAVYIVWIFASPRIPDKQIFDEWATDFHRAVRSGEIRLVPAAEGDTLSGINSAVQPMYVRTLETLRTILTSYRDKAPNIYVSLPAIPKNIFSGEAAAYRGGVIVSRDCAWFVHMDSTDFANTRRGPVLILDLMDGDGQTKGGRSIGTISFVYDFDNERLAVSATGTSGPILQNVERNAPANEIEFMASTIGRRLLEKQLQSCHVSESGR